MNFRKTDKEITILYKLQPQYQYQSVKDNSFY